MQFCFQLVPAEDILPVGQKPYLSWFWLTAGWFWIEVGDQELFRYSAPVLEHWARLYPEHPAPPLPYEDYYVVRYWEDLLDMLPAVLEPVPDDLAARVADSPAWEAWQEQAQEWLLDQSTRDWDTFDAAVRWWWQRIWNAAHLSNPPQIWLWRVGDVMHIRWDNHRIMVGNLPVWTAEQGEYTLPVEDFVDAVSDFHTRFLAAMEERVSLAQSPRFRPDVTIDRAHLQKEQHDRAAWLANALDPHRRATWSEHSWDDVRAALAAVEAGMRAGTESV